MNSCQEADQKILEETKNCKLNARRNSSKTRGNINTLPVGIAFAFNENKIKSNRDDYFDESHTIY